MPSLLHEGIIALVRERPALAADLLRELLHISVPAFTEARLAEASLNDLIPTEYRADAVVLLVDGAPVFGIILEAQLAVDPDKPFAWPMYAVSARARYRCPFVVLVVTPDASTARWAGQPVDLGGGATWRSLVVGPEGIPIITDVDFASREPHLAVLSAMAHGRDKDVATAVAVAAAAAAGVAGLPEPLRLLCFALIESSLGDAARKSFEMLPQGQRFFSETQRRSFSEGEKKGKAEGEAQALLRVLDRRGLSISAEQRERVLACSELAALEAWLDRAVTAESTEEVFAGSPLK
jgi:hypothetical protein